MTTSNQEPIAAGHHSHDDISEDDSEDFASFETSSISQIALENARGTIDRLYRLSFRIRNPSTRTGFTKAKYYRQIDQDTKIDLMEQYKSQDLRHVEEVLSQMQKCKLQDCSNKYLIERLAVANTQRRQQFGHWKSHKQKLEHAQDSVIRSKDGANATRLLRNIGTANGIDNTQRLEPAVRSTSSPSTATQLQDFLASDEKMSVGSTASYAILIEGPNAEKPAIPGLPPTVRNHPFECPYCWILCSEKTGVKQAWEAHVYRDLRPYVCTFEDCTCASQQYDSFKDWASHEMSHMDLKENVNRGRQAQMVSLIISTCPFCLDRNVSLAHVGLHLIRIAIFALPRSTGVEENDGDDKAASAKANSKVSSVEGLNSEIGSLPSQVSSKGSNRMKHRRAEAEQSDYLTNIAELAMIYRNQRRFKKAGELEAQVMETRKKALGVENPSTLDSMNNLATIYREQGRLKEAEELVGQVIETRKRVLGVEHPDNLKSISNLASVLHDQGKNDEAEQIIRQALEEMERALGKEHPDTLKSISNLAAVLHGQGKYDEAEQMNRRALEGRERVLGKEHLSTLRDVGNLAIVLQDQDKYEEAEQMSRRALEGRERVLGKEHPHTLTSVSNLVWVLQEQGKYEAAEELNQRALERRKVLEKEQLTH